MSDVLHVSDERISVPELLKLQDEEFVRSAYRSLLRREADPTGLAAYLKQVRRGADKGKILAAMAMSEEGLKKDSLRLPGLKDIVDASKSTAVKAPFLTRTLSRVIDDQLRPLMERVQMYECRIAELAETVATRMQYIEDRTEFTALRLQRLESRDVPAVGCATNVKSDNAPSGDVPVVLQTAIDVDRLVKRGASLELYARRSRADRRRQTLQRAFGDAIVTERFFAETLDISRQIKESGSGFSTLLDDVVIARWMLSSGVTNRAFEEVPVQLSMLYYSAFDCSKESRSATEMEVCNDVAARAVSDELLPTSYPGISITAFMLSAMNALSIKKLNIESVGARDSICRNFYFKVVPEQDLEHWITPAQREALRRPVAQGKWKDQITVLQSWLLENDIELQNRYPLSNSAEVSAFNAWYLDEGVWDHKLHYSLSADQLATRRLTICWKTNAELLVPEYFRLKGLIPAVDSKNIADWLRELVVTECSKRDLPRRLFDPSVFDYLWGSRRSPTQLPAEKRENATHQMHGVRGLRSGEILTFGESGNGTHYLIGGGWSYPEGAHVWSAQHSALLAINVAPEDDGPLGLLVEFLSGGQADASVAVLWNGKMVERVRARPHTVMRVTCELGREHRLGTAFNSLCLFVDQLWRPRDNGVMDDRTLGVALCKLKLIKR